MACLGCADNDEGELFARPERAAFEDVPPALRTHDFDLIEPDRLPVTLFWLKTSLLSRGTHLCARRSSSTYLEHIRSLPFKKTGSHAKLGGHPCFFLF